MAKQIPIGQRLRLARQLAGLSQRAVADAIGCTQANVCHIEHGRSRVSTDQLRAFAAFFGVSASSLLGEQRGKVGR